MGERVLQENGESEDFSRPFRGLTWWSQADYDDLAEGLEEDRSEAIQKIVDEACGLFAPLARREWVSWGGEVLFLDLAEELEREEKEAAEAKAREEAEWAEARRREAEEEAKREAAAARTAKVETRRKVLEETRAALSAEFLARTISKEELRARSAVIKAEAEAIQRIAMGQEDDEENKSEGEVEVMGGSKRKAAEEDEEDELDDEIEAKRARFEGSGLLDFEGPVSVRIYSNTLQS